MNTIEQKEITPEQRQELVQAFAAWSKSSVTQQMVGALRQHMNNTVDKICNASLAASVPDNLIRQYSVQLATYSQVLSFFTNANAFIGTIPTVKQ